jgi:hypothetical protein
VVEAVAVIGHLWQTGAAAAAGVHTPESVHTALLPALATHFQLAPEVSGEMWEVPRRKRAGILLSTPWPASQPAAYPVPMVMPEPVARVARPVHQPAIMGLCLAAAAVPRATQQPAAAAVALLAQEVLAAMAATLRPAAPDSEVVPPEVMEVGVILPGILAHLPVAVVEALSAAPVAVTRVARVPPGRSASLTSPQRFSHLALRSALPGRCRQVSTLLRLSYGVVEGEEARIRPLF